MSELISPRPTLLASDLDLVLKLIPRAQIVVGDIPAIYPTLQRLEQAAKSGLTFVPFVAPVETPACDGQAS